MKKVRKGKLISAILVASAIIICLTVILVANAFGQAEPDQAVEQTAAQAKDYPVNEYGLTYGNGNDMVERGGLEPDLIAARGIDGTVGYVYAKDLSGDNIPSSPDEAVDYMEDYEMRRDAAISKGEQYERVIPLYDETGQKAIGEFGISWAWLDKEPIKGTDGRVDIP